MNIKLMQSIFKFTLIQCSLGRRRCTHPTSGTPEMVQHALESVSPSSIVSEHEEMMIFGRTYVNYLNTKLKQYYFKSTCILYDFR